MASLIAPGMWIVLVMPEDFPCDGLTIEDKPYFCTTIGVLPTTHVCLACGPVDRALTVREFPRSRFCVIHWRPVLTPKTGAFDYLLAPRPTLSEALDFARELNQDDI